MILAEAHEGIRGGHYVGKSIAQKVLRAGLPYTEMLKTITEPTMYAKELGNCPEEMKCP